MTDLVYDAGALIAAERSDRRMLVLHARALERGIEPIVPATVLAQVRRGGFQRSLTTLLAGCRVMPLDRPGAELVGALLGAARRSDVVDAHVVIACLAAQASCVTSDPQDINHLVVAAKATKLTRRRVPLISL